MQHAPPRVRLLPTWLLVCLVAGSATAQAQTWGGIELPGGVTAARQLLNLGTETRTPTAFLLDFVRTYHQFGDVDSAAVDRFERYIRYVQQLQGALAVWRDGLSLGSGRLQGQSRDRWRAMAELLGLRLREVKNRPVLEPDDDDASRQHSEWLAALGIDVRRLAQQLNQGETVRLAVPVDTLPLPLPALWPALLEQGGRPNIVRLGVSHRPALLYVGLMSLDTETLTFLASHAEALDFGDAEAGAFSAFGRSFRVRGNRVDVPGGAAYAPIWSQLLDRRLDEPVEFFRRLMSRDEGRLAFFYDSVSHVAPALQAALFEGARGGQQRLEALEGHYRWFRDVDPEWKVGVRPFFRPAIDPSLVLALLDVGPDGSIGSPWWPHVLEEIAGDDGWPDRPIRELEDRPARLSWALRWIFDSKDSAGRFRLLRFAQRRFATSPRTAAAPVEMALRGFKRMPALLLALERIGVREPSVMADVASAAARLTDAGDLDRVEPVLRRWQGALAVLEQVARRREIPAATRDGLLLALAKLVPADGLPAPGAIATWVIDQFNPALGGPAIDDLADEGPIIEAWLAPAGQSTRTLTWEGLEYRIDRVGPAVRDAAAVRKGIKGPTLGHLALLVQTRREIEAGVKALDRTKELSARLETVRKKLLELRNEENDPLYKTDDLEDAARTITRIRQRDLSRVARQLPKILQSLDIVTEVVLPALAYALAAAPTAQPQIYGDSALRHRVSDAAAPSDQWRTTAWVLPKEGPLPTGGNGILGGLLALDTVLADGQLRRLAAIDASAPPVEGMFNPVDRDALVLRLLYASRLEALEASAMSASAALAAGRARWMELSRGDESTRASAEAALYPVLGEHRANLLLWLRDRKLAQATEELLLPSELARLGAAAPLPVEFGMSSSAFDGCLCLALPPSRPIGEWLGRGDSGHLSVLTVDVQLRMSQALAELKLPAFLVELTLPMALQDTIDRVSQFSPDDWEAIAIARFIPKERVEEYLLALVAEGVLAPPATTGKGH